MQDDQRLLVAHENADLWCAELDARFPGLDYRIARSPAELDGTYPATMAYSCVTDGFPRQAHGCLAQRPGLAWIHVGGSGFDHLAGGGEGPLLTNGAGVLAPYLAETLIGALFALARGFPQAVRQQIDKRWQPWSFEAIEGRTLGVVGTGAIGKALADRARALGLRVIGLARNPEPHPAFDEVRPIGALEEVAREADFLSLNISLVDETRHLLDARILGAMRPTAFLLNASRGAVVDEAALIEALAEGRIAGAYLDVFETEPLPAGSPLWTMPSVLLTPHMSDRVADWELRHARFFLDNLERRLRGLPLLNVVGP